MKRYVLATSSYCGPCMVLKKKLEREGMEVETVDMVKDMAFFKENEIRSVPRLVVFEDEVKTDVISSVEDIFNYLKTNPLEVTD